MTISSQEKTRNKLMDSMRKTKASATGKTEPAATTKNVEKKEPQQSKRAVAAKPAKAATKKVTKKVSKTAADQYQASRRVWPD